MVSESSVIRSLLARFWKFDSLPWEAAQAFSPSSPSSSLPSGTLAPEGRPRSSLASSDKALWGQRRASGGRCLRNPEGEGTRPGAECQPDLSMQVSFVCSEHGLKGRGPDERLGRPSASSPSLATRGRFRTVAMVARSLGQLSVQSHPSTGDASVKQPGMKYRYEAQWLYGAGGSPTPSRGAGKSANPFRLGGFVS